MSRIISIALLLIAGTILLAHDVIPHQHHDDHVCFEHSSCQAEHPDESQNDENNPCCPLAEIVFYTPGNSTHEIVCPFFIFDSSWDKDYCCPPHGNYDLLPLVFTPLPFLQNPYEDFHYLWPLSYTFGLRAPPVA